MHFERGGDAASAIGHLKQAAANAVKRQAFQESIDLAAILNGELSEALQLTSAAAYVVVALFLEPFFVASGFAMYLNRRASLEAWDIEQEFRRAFAQ